MGSPARAEPRTYLPHVEGLRGVAALYVFVFHVWQTAVQHADSATLRSLFAQTQILQYGHYAVAAFIVISGYCLGLPVARRPGKAFDAKRFFQRRARRLMPAYVPVVVLSALPFALTAVVYGKHVNLPHIVMAIALHIALVHNLLFATTEYLNGPLWSIALEAQIYVVFALVLVPVWRRFGLAAQFGVALAVGFLPHFMLHQLDWTVPWFVALFALGLIVADLTTRKTLPRLPWNALALAAAAIAIVCLMPFRDGVTTDFWLWPGDFAVGAAIALFFVAAHRNPRIAPARLLSLPPVVFLGTFSYSVYLIHAPIVDLAGALLYRGHAGTALSLTVFALLGILVLALAYGMYRLLERPFMTPSFTAAMTEATAAPALAPRVVAIVPSISGDVAETAASVRTAPREAGARG